MIDLTPSTDRTRSVVAHLAEDQLDLPTPAGMTVGQVVQHVIGLSLAFRDAAAKLDNANTNTPPSPATEPLPEDWHRLADDGLQALAGAWQDPDAWTGMTKAGGVDLPGDICGLVALDEVLLHGWDLARATGQEYAPSAAECDAIRPIVTPDPSDPDGSGRTGLFGAVVAVPDDAEAFDQILGLAGRDPNWTA